MSDLVLLLVVSILLFISMLVAYKSFIASKGKITGIDLAAEELRKAEEKAHEDLCTKVFGSEYTGSGCYGRNDNED